MTFCKTTIKEILREKEDSAVYPTLYILLCLFAKYSFGGLYYDNIGDIDDGGKLHRQAKLVEFIWNIVYPSFTEIDDLDYRINRFRTRIRSHFIDGKLEGKKLNSILYKEYLEMNNEISKSRCVPYGL